MGHRIKEANLVKHTQNMSEHMERKYRSTNNKKNGKRKGQFLPRMKRSLEETDQNMVPMVPYDAIFTVCSHVVRQNVSNKFFRVFVFSSGDLFIF